MKDQSSINILQWLQEWCGSPIGTITIMIILASIGIIAVMAAKESYGKGSFEHRVVRVIAISIYTILTFNITGKLILKIASIHWLAVTLLLIIYVTGIWIAERIDRAIVLIIATIILIGGIYGRDYFQFVRSERITCAF